MEHLRQQGVREPLFDTKMMNALVRKATEVNKEHSLDMGVFIEAFGKEKVLTDYARVADRLAQHMENKMTESEKIGHIFESAFLQVASKHKWFGDRSEITKASKYDDILNGIDMITTVVDSTNTARHFEIASDLTTSYPGTASKFNRIKQNVFEGRLATVNYFHSDLMGFTGRMTDIPRTVIALQKEHVVSFLKTWQQEPEMAQEQFSMILLHQIAAQCDGFAKYAKNIHGSDSRIYNRYMSAHDVSQEIIASKPHIPVPEDRTLEAIRNMSARVANE